MVPHDKNLQGFCNISPATLWVEVIDMYEIIRGCIVIIDEVIEQCENDKLNVVKAALEVALTELDIERDKIETERIREMLGQQ